MDMGKGTAISFTAMKNYTQVTKPSHHQHFNCFSPHHLSSSRTAVSISENSRFRPQPFKLAASVLSPSCLSSRKYTNGNCEENVETMASGSTSRAEKKKMRKRVFLLDVNPLCYDGNVPSLQSFAHWISLFFSQVSLSDPVIAVSHLYPVSHIYPFL